MLFKPGREQIESDEIKLSISSDFNIFF